MKEQQSIHTLSELKLSLIDNFRTFRRKKLEKKKLSWKKKFDRAKSVFAITRIAGIYNNNISTTFIDFKKFLVFQISAIVVRGVMR